MIDFIILGAQKAATSALQANLRLNPSVHMPEGESPFFEDPEYQLDIWKTIGEGSDSNKVNGIKRPDYLCSEVARSRITKSLPNCKFIVVLREPISRAISSYCYMIRHAHLAPMPLNEGLEYCIGEYLSGNINRASEVIYNGLYGDNLCKWMEYYPKDRFLIISQKDVSEDLNNVLKKSLIHLGINQNLRTPATLQDTESNVGLYDPRMLKIARIASLIKTKPLSNSNRRIPRNFFLRTLGIFISRGVEIISKSIPQNRESLSPEILHELAKIYDEDFVKLREIANPESIYWK